MPRGDERGWLVAVEGMKEIPFDIKRIFYIFGTKGDTVRGCHANRRSEFVLINLCGECTVSTDNGCGEKLIFQLNEPNKGIFIPKMCWKEMYAFSQNSILLCLASELYDPSEYIRDYRAYCDEMRGVHHG
jgi:dTDP-4-dehydrorhamnose 3,5-epimerase-like enzyme